MANLASIEFAKKGETGQPAKHAEKDYSGMITYNGKNVSEKEWYIFKLVNNTRKGGMYIPNIDDVVNPDTGNVERIRLLSGVKTIWQSEQKELTENFIRQSMRSIEFPRGVKIRRVASVDKTLLDFMRICNSNVGNPARIRGTKFEFFEYDAAAADKAAFDKEDFELEMALIAKQENPETMRKNAAFFGINMINDLGDAKTIDGIRREYIMYAKRNPDYFKRSVNTEQVEVSWLVRKAIADALIDAGREDGKIYWGKSGGIICYIPRGTSAQDYLTQLAMTNNDEGVNFKDQLIKIVT
jgi:hypothetical protein